MRRICLFLALLGFSSSAFSAGTYLALDKNESKNCPQFAWVKHEQNDQESFFRVVVYKVKDSLTKVLFDIEGEYNSNKLYRRGFRRMKQEINVRENRFFEFDVEVEQSTLRSQFRPVGVYQGEYDAESVKLTYHSSIINQPTYRCHFIKREI